MRRIFISHSTAADDADGRAYVNALVSGLSAARDENDRPRFEIFYDRKSLEGGDDWNLKIVNYLIYCHAAVFVLSPRALESEFVKFEVSNLMARRARQRDPNNQPSFVVVPVLPWIPGTADSPQAFQKDIFAKLDEGFWKAIGFSAAINLVGPADAPTILQDLLPRLSGVEVESQDEAIAQLERDIATYLENVKPDLMEAAAKAADFPPPPPGATTAEAALHVTRALLLLPLDRVFKALDQMRASLKQDLVEVFHLLAPCWVSPEAARLLAGPLERNPPGCCVILNGQLLHFTPEMYVRRARGRGRKTAGKVMELNEPVSAVHDAEELRHRVRELLRDMVPVPGNVQDSRYGSTLKQQLQIRSKVVPYVIAVPLSSEATLPLLLQVSRFEEFASVLFIGLSGDALFRTTDPGVVCMTPELRADQESYANTLYDTIVELIA